MSVISGFLSFYLFKSRLALVVVQHDVAPLNAVAVLGNLQPRFDRAYHVPRSLRVLYIGLRCRGVCQVFEQQKHSRCVFPNCTRVTEVSKV